MYDENMKCLLRNSNDKKTDVSVIGSVVPFKMFGPKEKKVQNTIERINMTLRTYTGGYLRFEGDNYRDGKIHGQLQHYGCQCITKQTDKKESTRMYRFCGK